MRTQERADVAAHLHDSVLQTLALIQKNPTTRPAWRAPRSATCGPGCSPRSRSTSALSPARSARWPVRSRTPTEPQRRRGRRGRLRPRRGDAADRVRRARGDHQCRQARGGPADRHLRRDHAGRGRRLRPRPGCGIRPGCHPGGPARRAAQHHRPDGTATAAPPTYGRRRATAPRCGCTSVVTMRGTLTCQ